jgi:hypothetical protein
MSQPQSISPSHNHTWYKLAIAVLSIAVIILGVAFSVTGLPNNVSKTSPQPSTKPAMVNVYGRASCFDACANNPGYSPCSPCYPFKVTFYDQNRFTASSNISANRYYVPLPNARQYEVSIFYYFSPGSDVNAVVQDCAFFYLDSLNNTFGYNVVC